LAGVPQVTDLDVLSPISDVRGTAEYRRDAALTLLRRALGQVGDE
jgi:CO/xanthine dehydrogenase FAD-binding subunit